jgi:hypothetical protein
MTPERFSELFNARGLKGDQAVLTLEETSQGWHFCPEWDGLLVGPESDGEWGDNPKQCRCGRLNTNKVWLE